MDKNFFKKRYEKTRTYVQVAVLAAFISLANQNDALGQTKERSIPPKQSIDNFSDNPGKPVIEYEELDKHPDFSEEDRTKEEETGSAPVTPKIKVGIITDDEAAPVIEDSGWDKPADERTDQESQDDFENDLVKKAIEEYQKQTGESPDEETIEQIIKSVRFEIKQRKAEGGSPVI